MARVDPRVLELAERVQALATERGRADLARALAWWVRTLEAAPGVTLVLAGRTNSGKSSLLNALLAADIVAEGAHGPTPPHPPSGAGRRWKPRACTVRVRRARSGSPRSARSSTRPRMEAPAPQVELYELDIAHPLLAAGVSLVDLPGIGDASGASERALVAERLLAADVLVFESGRRGAVSRPEAEFLARRGRPRRGRRRLRRRQGRRRAGPGSRRGRGPVRCSLTQPPSGLRRPSLAPSARELALAERSGHSSLAAASGVPALARHRHRAPRAAPSRRQVGRPGAVLSCRRGRARSRRAASRLAGDLDAGQRAEAAVATHRRYVEGTTAWTADFAREFQRCTRQVVERDLRMRLLECREAPRGADPVRRRRARGGHRARPCGSRRARRPDGARARRAGRRAHERLDVAAPARAGRPSARRDDGRCHCVLLPGGDLGGEWQAREVTHGLAGLVNLARSAASGPLALSLVGGGGGDGHRRRHRHDRPQLGHERMAAPQGAGPAGRARFRPGRCSLARRSSSSPPRCASTRSSCSRWRRRRCSAASTNAAASSPSSPPSRSSRRSARPTTPTAPGLPRDGGSTSSSRGRCGSTASPNDSRPSLDPVRAWSTRKRTEYPYRSRRRCPMTTTTRPPTITSTTRPTTAADDLTQQQIAASASPTTSSPQRELPCSSA